MPTPAPVTLHWASLSAKSDPLLAPIDIVPPAELPIVVLAVPLLFIKAVPAKVVTPPVKVVDPAVPIVPVVVMLSMPTSIAPNPEAIEPAPNIPVPVMAIVPVVAVSTRAEL